MNLDTEKRNNVTVDYLKAIACITVVLQHCLSYILSKQTEGFTLLTELYSYSSKLNVPLFFMISGYLLHQQPIGIFMKKKIPRLLIPFFFFSGLKLIYSLFISDEFAHGGSVQSQLYKAFAVGELYWFSYSILLMFLIAPLIWKTKTIVRGNKKYELPIIAIVCFVLLIIFNTVNKQYNIVTFPYMFQIDRTITYIPFFLAGFIWRNIYPIIGDIKKTSAVVLFILSLPLIWSARKIEMFVYFTSTCVSVLLCMDIWLLVKPFKKIPFVLRMVSKYTYQVFFIDSFVKIIIFTLIEKLVGTTIYQNLAICLLIVLSEVFADVCLSCIISFIAEKIPIINILFGLSKTSIKAKK